jgi:hypothetical protein
VPLADNNTVGVIPVAAFIQYGAVGILALASITALVVLWRSYEKHKEQMADVFRQEKEQLQAFLEQAQQRADRLESKLLELNAVVSEQFAGELVRATEAIKECVELMRGRRRW